MIPFHLTSQHWDQLVMTLYLDVQLYFTACAAFFIFQLMQTWVHALVFVWLRRLHCCAKSLSASLTSTTCSLWQFICWKTSTKEDWHSLPACHPQAHTCLRPKWRCPSSRNGVASSPVTRLVVDCWKCWRRRTSILLQPNASRIYFFQTSSQVSDSHY